MLFGVWVLLSLSWTVGAEALPKVRAVIFFPPFCADCPAVIDEFLFPLSAEFGQQLEIHPVDITLAPGDGLYQEVLVRFGAPQDSLQSPAILVGDSLLVGRAEIIQGFPDILERGLEAGGIDWPQVPGLQQLISGSSVADAESESTMNDAVATGLAWAVMVGMVVALSYAVWLLARAGRATLEVPPVLTWGIPIMALLGLAIGGYLTYVELTHSEAMCGPIGDCLAVQSSPYSRLFGIPMAQWGVAFYLGVLILWLMNRVLGDTWHLPSALALLGFSIFGVLFSIYLTSLELFVIGAVCLWCLSSAAIGTVLMLLVVTKLASAGR